jgi:protein translocase SecG subunit
MHVVYIILVTLQFLIGVALIAVVTMQESKNEGLQGQIGTTATTSFKGKAGREEQLNLVIRNVSIAFFAISLLVAIGAGRW